MTQPSHEAGSAWAAQQDLMAERQARYTDASSGILVDPKALCDSDKVGNSVGAGTRIWPFAHVGGKIGADCNISNYVAIEAEATIGNRVTVKPFVVLCDGVTIEDDVFIGPGVMFANDLQPRAAIKRSDAELPRTLVRTGATLAAGVLVAAGVTIGAHAFIGVNAVVMRDVPAYGLILGDPGRLVGWACECGVMLRDGLDCVCGRAYKQESTGLIKIA